MYYTASYEIKVHTLRFQFIISIPIITNLPVYFENLIQFSILVGWI